MLSLGTRFAKFHTKGEGSIILKFKSIYLELMGALRILLAIAVLGFHSGLQILGPFAVYVFFIISGYAIFSGLKDTKQSESKLVGFLKRRLKKLLPAYFLTCFVVSILCVLLEKLFPNSSLEFVTENSAFKNVNLFEILKTWIPRATLDSEILALNPNVLLVHPWWSVMFELGFYILCASIFIQKNLIKIFLALYFIIALSLHVLLVIRTGQDLSKLNALIYFNFFGTVIFFMFGNLISYFSKAKFENRVLNSLAGLLIIGTIFMFPMVFGDPTQILPGKPVSGYLLILYLITLFTFVYLFTLNIHKPTGRIDAFLANHSYGIYVYQSLSFPIIAISERELHFPVTTGIQRFLVIFIFTALLSLIGDYFISKLGSSKSSLTDRYPKTLP